MTYHFIARYNERILHTPNGSYSGKAVKKDILKRLTEREKECIELFVSSNKKVVLPLGQVNKMIVLNGSFITVY